jgi:hypothetical protein
MRCDSRASLLACTLASFYLGREPKARVTTVLVKYNMCFSCPKPLNIKPFQQVCNYIQNFVFKPFWNQVCAWRFMVVNSHTFGRTMQSWMFPMVENGL